MNFLFSLPNLKYWGHSSGHGWPLLFSFTCSSVFIYALCFNYYQPLMIPKSLWAHSLVLYKHFPEHSHSLDCSGGPSSSTHTLSYSPPPQFLMLISDHYPVYFVPSPLPMSVPPLPAPNFNQTLFEHLSVRSRSLHCERREIYSKIS